MHGARRYPQAVGSIGLIAVLLLSGLVGGGVGAHARAPAPSAGHASDRPGVPRLAAIPLRPPHRASLLPRTAAVDPTAYYSSEPAPMGISDFGVTPNGTAYSYQTSGFYGDTVIHKLKVDNSAIDSTALSIQLNIVLSFDQGGTNYQYWVQDVAFLDTSSDALGFENNIWNFSAGSGSMNDESVAGNGSVYGSQVYIAGADSNLPGASVTVSYPVQIGLLAWATVSGGAPEVIFEYRDGYGWVTYDNAVFPFAKGATAINYTVNGSGYNNLGIFDDAELILGGPGDGSTTSASSANLSMSLAYFNGRNFQAVPNAYNFGSDTAETISGLGTRLGHYGTNGSLWDNVTGGTSSLGPLYNASYAGSVEVFTRDATGSLRINGTDPIAYNDSPVNLTIAPGNYSFAIWSQGSLVVSQAATLYPGTRLILYLNAGEVSNVTFEETGLPAGHAWWVSLSGSTAGSSEAAIRFQTVNGTFGWRVGYEPGFVPNVTHGTVTANGTPLVVSINFTELVYPISVEERGLPEGTAWSIVVGNSTFNSTGDAVEFDLPNGSYVYRLGLVPGWIGTPTGQGDFRVNGGFLDEGVAFTAFTYPAAFLETGLPAPSIPWGVLINGRSESANTTNGSAVAALPNGTFTYVVEAPAGWIASPSQGNVLIEAAAVAVAIHFRPFPFAVIFTEAGLPAGTPWGVQVGTEDLHSSNASIDFELPNGTYTYQVDTVLGFGLLTPVNASFGIAGGLVGITVVFERLAAIVGTLEGSFVPADAQMFIDGYEVSTPNGTFNLSLVPGVHAVEIAAAGFHPFFTNVTIVAGGLVDLAAISLAPVSHTGSGSNGSLSRNVSGGLVLSTEDLAILALAIAAIVVVFAIVMARRRP